MASLLGNVWRGLSWCPILGEDQDALVCQNGDLLCPLPCKAKNENRQEMTMSYDQELADAYKRIRKLEATIFEIKELALSVHQEEDTEIVPLWLIDKCQKALGKCTCEYGWLGTGRMDSNVCPIHDKRGESVA